MFPIGSTVDNGRYRITEHLFGTADRGVYRGRDSMTAGNVLISLAPAQQRARANNFELELPRVAQVRHIGPLASDTKARYDALVEDEPDGIRASDVRLNAEAARWVALETARITHLANERGVVLCGVRPEAIYLWGTVPQVTGIVPRFETFFSTAGGRDYGVPACFEHVYLAPEVVACPSRRHPPRQTSSRSARCSPIS